jgi:hypothetical protein
MNHRTYLGMILGVMWLCASVPAFAKLGASDQQMVRLLGNPLKSSGEMVHYHKSPISITAHFFHHICDQICVYSDQESMGLPAPLAESDLDKYLMEFGGGRTWTPVGRSSINRVWNSADQRCFAIYDTMRNKLVIMTREAYSRERHARP